ncbi:MAG: glutamate--tRNA ligase [Sulfobacillus thermosulfidooxidans]|uniref:Glutamate--tRNA ligase n=1 Tax=Sulfobacillus thermotolerans TaxID=338644 RepID=A0ABM6RN37_9FIRM|nr:glutamate--tRNA ligase [Sulfobacillus thermotolerans]PSR36272.1 MAG: glutamate--tRNA ligase [Sulfobacillus thermosulfidooxidans]
MVRVRYAPSPTGTLHIGGARTALFNYLFARHHHGRFILRVEDTDQARLVEGSEESMMRGLKSLGLVWDEGPDVGGDYGPYHQSERLARHKAALQQLLDAGQAYRCYCTPEELAEERARQEALKQPPRYSGKCRMRPQDDPIHTSGKPFVVRMKVPEEGTTVVQDLIRGPVTFENRILGDFVLAKSDGTPVYNFAVVLDDYDMAITHVIRGEEHLSNTPKQILVYQALNLDLPAFAHVPMILAPDHTKLSKRHGATSVEEYRQQGILPEALTNYLLLLGWSAPDDTEIMTLEQAAQWFDLDRVQHTAAIYDIKKLEWMNSQYLRLLPVDRIKEAVTPFLAAEGIVPESGPDLDTVIALVRERARTLVELAQGMAYFYVRPQTFEAKGVQKHFDATTPERLRALAEVLSQLSTWDHDSLMAAYDAEAARLEVKRAALIHPSRLAVTGRTVGPGLFELLEVLGQKETVDRLLETATAIENGHITPTP